MTTELANQVDPHGNDAADDHLEAFCDGCADTHYPGEHRPLIAPELAVLRTAATLTIAGPQYTDTYLVGRSIAVRGILANSANRNAYADHVDTLIGMGLLEVVDGNTPTLGDTGQIVEATTAALDYLTTLDRRTR
jgi:hypothetical protein